MRAMLIGNYGVGNLGDELLREYFLQRFAGVEWTVVSAWPSKNSREVPRLPMGFRSLFTPWWRTLGALRRCDAVVLGGGTLFTDVESVAACFIWGLHIFAARLFRKPVFLAFQGIGPLRTRAGAWWTRYAIRSSAFVSVRDAASAMRVRVLAPNRDPVESFDPAILLFAAENGNGGSKMSLLVVPRPRVPETFATRAMTLWQGGQYAAARILSLQPDNPAEQDVCHALLEVIPGAEIVSARTLAELSAAVQQAEYVFTARYHGALAACAAGVPFDVFFQEEGDKIASFPMGVPRAELEAQARKGEEALKEALGTLSRLKVIV